MSLLSENVLRAADVVIVPLVPSPLSIRMLRELYAFVAAEGWSDLRLLPFFSMVDRRRSLHLELMASARAEFPAILGTEVPYRSEIERMTVRRTPLPAGGAASEAALIYRQLWQQIVQQAEPAAAHGQRQRRAAVRYPAGWRNSRSIPEVAAPRHLPGRARERCATYVVLRRCVSNYLHERRC